MARNDPLAGLLAGRRIGYGAAMRHAASGPPSLDANHIRRLLRLAVELGAPLIDTAGSYGRGISETIIAEALAPYPPRLIIATKGGVRFTAQGEKIIDARPDQLRAACEASLRRLRVETLDLFQLHWPDPALPLAEQVGALAELQRAGKVRHVGLCNVSVGELIESEEIVSIASVQLPFGLMQKNDLDVLAHAAERGIAFIAYGPLAILRAALPSIPAQDATGQARARGCTLPQFALDWALRQGPHVVAIPGTLSVAHLKENMSHLTPALA